MPRAKAESTSTRRIVKKSADIVESSDSDDVPLATSKHVPSPCKKPAPKRKIKVEDVEKESSDKERRAHAQKKLRVHSLASPETQKLSEDDDSLVEVVETKRVSKRSAKAIYMAEAEESDGKTREPDVCKVTVKGKKKSTIQPAPKNKGYIEISDNSGDNAPAPRKGRHAEMEEEQSDEGPKTPKMQSKGKKYVQESSVTPKARKSLTNDNIKPVAKEGHHVGTEDEQSDEEPKTPNTQLKGKKSVESVMSRAKKPLHVVDDIEIPPKKGHHVEIKEESGEELPEVPDTQSKGKKYMVSPATPKVKKPLVDNISSAKANVTASTVPTKKNDKKSAIGPTHSAKLYPKGFDIPDDSDYDNQEDIEPIVTELMPLKKQDPKLRVDYIDLPEIPYKEMHSFFKGNHGTEEYHLVWAALESADKLELRRFRSAIRFTHSLPFVNPSRILLAMVQRDENRIALASNLFKKQSAIFLTTGVVSQCQLIVAGNSLTSGNYKVKQILLCPFGVEYERAGAFFGSALEVKDYVGQLFNGNLVFMTRGEGHSSGGATGLTSPGPATPTRTNRGRKAISFKNAPAISFPSSLSFNDTVPIYDVRNTDFAFTADKLTNLNHLPLYKDGKADLPPDMLATVGYTISSYTYRASNPSWQGYTVLSLNVLFIIALGEVNHGKLNVISELMAEE